MFYQCNILNGDKKDSFETKRNNKRKLGVDEGNEWGWIYVMLRC